MIDFVTLKRLFRSLRQPRQGRIAYIGWTGHRNLGDEALYEAAQRLLPDYALYPSTRKTRKLRLLRWLEQRGGVIAYCLGGGTLIYSGNNNCRAVHDALQTARPVFSLGTGVVDPAFWRDDPHFFEQQVRWNELLPRFSILSVRGPQSQAILEHCGCRNVRITGDLALVFSKPPRKDDPHDRLLGVNVGTSRGNVWGGSEDQVLGVVGQAVHRLQKRGWHVTIFSVWPPDYPLCVRLARRLNLSRSAVAKHYVHAEAFQHAVSRCSAFVGMKLHSVILACCAQVPSVMLEYHPKCADFMASMELLAYNLRVDTMKPEDIVERVEEVYGKRSVLRPHLHERCRYYVDKLKSYARDVAHGNVLRAPFPRPGSDEG